MRSVIILLIAAAAVALFAQAGTAEEPSLEWVENTGSYVYSAPVFQSNMLFVGTLSGNMNGILVTLGETQWPWPVNYKSGISSPLIVDNDKRLYFGTSNGIFSSVDSMSAEERWTFQADANIDSTPLLFNSLLVFGSDALNGTGRVYALNADKGRLEWNVSVGGLVSYGLTAGNNVVYFGSQDGNLYAVETYSGKTRWITPLDSANRSKVYSPTLDNEVIYVGVGDTSVYAVDIYSGSPRWIFSQMQGPVVSKPLCMLGNVYAGSQDGYIYALNASTGKLVWKYQTGSPVKATPLFDASGQAPIIYAGSENGNVYAIDAKFGLPYWQYKASGSVDTTPIIVTRAAGDSHLYFTTVGGDVYALKLPSKLVMGTPSPQPTVKPEASATPGPTPTPTPVPLPTSTPAPLSPAIGLAGLLAAGLVLAWRRR